MRKMKKICKNSTKNMRENSACARKKRKVLTNT